MPKTGIHPQYHVAASVTCSCGAKYSIGSTLDSLKVDICRECHPFYSGNQKLIDAAGRVDRFREKVAAAKAYQSKGKSKSVSEPKPNELALETEKDAVEITENDLSAETKKDSE